MARGTGVDAGEAMMTISGLKSSASRKSENSWSTPATFGRPARLLKAQIRESGRAFRTTARCRMPILPRPTIRTRGTFFSISWVNYSARATV